MYYFLLKCFTEFTSEATWACSFLYEKVCDYKLNFTKCPMWTRCSENPPPSAAQDGGWGRPTAGGAWGAAPVACGSVASFPLEFLTHIPARPPPPLPDHSSSRQGPQLSKPRVYTPSPPPHTHTHTEPGGIIPAGDPCWVLAAQPPPPPQ